MGYKVKLTTRTSDDPVYRGKYKDSPFCESKTMWLRVLLNFEDLKIHLSLSYFESDATVLSNKHIQKYLQDMLNYCDPSGTKEFLAEKFKTVEFVYTEE